MDNNKEIRKLVREVLEEFRFLKTKESKKMTTPLQKRGKNLDFKGVYSSEKPGPEYELVLANCFTEPFPSTHDMDDWHIDNLTSMLINFDVIKSFKSSDYYFHQKEHFVNHDIMQAIIMVDLYKKI